MQLREALPEERLVKTAPSRRHPPCSRLLGELPQIIDRVLHQPPVPGARHNGTVQFCTMALSVLAGERLNLRAGDENSLRYLSQSAYVLPNSANHSEESNEEHGLLVLLKNMGYLFSANSDGFRRVDARRLRKLDQVKKGSNSSS
jgi:hypothetical protein